MFGFVVCFVRLSFVVLWFGLFDFRDLWFVVISDVLVGLMFGVLWVWVLRVSGVCLLGCFGVACFVFGALAICSLVFWWVFDICG